MPYFQNYILKVFFQSGHFGFRKAPPAIFSRHSFNGQTLMVALSQPQYFEYFDCNFGRKYWFVFCAPETQPFVSSSIEMVSPWLRRRFPLWISEACQLPASSTPAPAAPSSSSVAVGVLLASETHARSGLLTNETQRRDRALPRPLGIFFVLLIKCLRFFSLIYYTQITNSKC